jgi:penicillin-binding protein 1A
MQSSPQLAGSNAPRVIDPRNAWLMTSMMQDVVRAGTAASAGQLGRGDLAGKTGTTNDARDTWFAGYNPDLVAIAWMGYDQPRSLGKRETGAQSALPIWINFMGTALRNVPQRGWGMPEGIVSERIDPTTGTRLTSTVLDSVLENLLNTNAPGMVEHFYQEFPPPDPPAAHWGEDPGQSATPGFPL